MRLMTKMLAGAAGLAAIAAAAPAAAQYYQSSPYSYQSNSYGYQSSPYASQYGYNGYNNGYTNGYAGYNNGYTGYNNGYTNGYGSYGYAEPAYGANAGVAQQQCSSAVQSRLYNRTSIGSILGSMIGLNTNTQGRVLSVTQIAPRGNGLLRVRGLASSGRYAYNNYSPYGVGAYGALGAGYNNAADLSWRCDVSPAGYVTDVSISRR